MALSRLAVALGRVEDARAHLARARESVDRAVAPLLAAAIDELERSLGDGPPSVAPVDGGGLPGTNVFHHEGPFWTLSYRDRTVRVKDAKGLQDLARLLAEPGRELHVLDLGAPGAGADRQRAGEAGTAEGDLGVLLDARARADYRRRLAELEDALAEAEAHADLARAEKARAERDFIAHELAAALGIGGRARRVGDPAERARKAVTGRIRMAIARIDHEHPALGRHLANAVRTGTYCAYEPEVDTTWEL
jgi:hypothetical protein